MSVVPKRVTRALVLGVVVLYVLVVLMTNGFRKDLDAMYKLKTPTLSSLFYSSEEVLTWEDISEALTFRSSVYEPDAPPAYVVKDSQKYYKAQFKKKISEEPKGMHVTHRSPDDDTYVLANATLVAVVENSELEQLVRTVRQIERQWNWRYHYPYTFFNHEPFSEEFKKEIQEECSGPVTFEQIAEELWGVPESIDAQKQQEGVDHLTSKGVQFADDLNYHHRSRFKAAHFYNVESMKRYKYYWNFEAGNQYHCRLDYDLFKFMEENKLLYGFTIALYDNPWTEESLWPQALKFIRRYPGYVNRNASFSWLTESYTHPESTEITNGYSTCHFWSSFEIGDMDFYRSPPYSKWMNYLERSGGFYYERWGESPVHSIGLSLFADKSRIWWFRDVGFSRSPYSQYPLRDNCRYHGDYPGYFAEKSVWDQNCLPNWVRYEMTEEQLEAFL